MFDFGKSMQPFNIYTYMYIFATFALVSDHIRYIYIYTIFKIAGIKHFQSLKRLLFLKRSSPKNAWKTGPVEASSTFAGSGEPRGPGLEGDSGAVSFQSSGCE